MSLIFLTQVQIAIKHHLETIKSLLDAPHRQKRDTQVKRHLHLIESLVMLEPSGTSRDIPPIEANRRVTKAV